MRNSRYAIALGAILLPLGCSNSDTSSAAAPVNVVWISKGKCNSFFVVSREGAALAGQDLTSASGRSVNVNLMEPDDCEDAGTTTSTTDAGVVDAGPPDPCASTFHQQDVLQAAIESKPGAIGLDVANAACTDALINQAVASGIKVITFDSDDAKSNRNTYYGTDNKAAAVAATKVLATLIGDAGKIVVQTSETKDAMGNYALSTSSVYMDRMTGFMQEIASHPNITVLPTLPCTGNDPTDSFCSDQVEAQMKATPDLKGIFFARGKILREVNIATEAPTFTAAIKAKTINTVAFDAPDDAITNIKAGYAQLVINQKLFGWGYDVVTLAFDMVTINRQVTSFTDSGYDTICPNNLDQFIAFTTAKDFRQPLTKCQYLP